MEKQSVWKEAQRHIMTGIGYMIPVIISGSIVLGLVKLIAVAFGWVITGDDALNSANIIIKLFAWINAVAVPQTQNLMYPVFAGYLAYSIADRQGLTAGLFGGLLAMLSGSGFIGALIIGFVAGYSMLFLKEHLVVNRKYRSVMNMMIYPLLGTAIVFIVSFLIVNPLGAAINSSVQKLITSVGAYGELPLVAAIAAGMAFDCGGPVNKAAFAVGFSLAGAGFTKLPVTFGAMIAPLGFGLAVILSNIIFRKKKLFTEDLDSAGTPALILGLFNVTEGALPLVMSDPLFMIPINMIGSAVGAVLAHSMGVFLPISRAGNILGFVLQENPLLYMACLFIGAGVVAGLTILRRLYLVKKNPIVVEA